RMEVEQGHSVVRPVDPAVELRRGELAAVIEIGVAGPVEVFAVRDQRALVEVGQEQSRTEETVADDQVWADVEPSLQGFGNGLIVPHRDLEMGAAGVRLERSPTRSIPHHANPPLDPIAADRPSARPARGECLLIPHGQLAIDERALIAMTFYQEVRHMAKMSGAFLVDKDDVHFVVPVRREVSESLLTV